MTIHLYLSLIPEALIASMLSPEEFGSYYAVGHHMKSKGKAVFFEIDSSFRNEFLPIEDGIRRCIPHKDGSPKASVYISVYRALEHMSLDAIQKLYLVSSHGLVLGLDSSDEFPDEDNRLRLYQEIAPVSHLVVSNLAPVDFYYSITVAPLKLIKFPALAFTELDLGELAEDPEHGAIGDLPYPYIDHLRECLVELNDETKHSKMIDRLNPAAFPYRMVKNGFFIGVKDRVLYYSMPSYDELRGKYYRWWRSANR